MNPIRPCQGTTPTRCWFRCLRVFPEGGRPAGYHVRLITDYEKPWLQVCPDFGVPGYDSVTTPGDIATPLEVKLVMATLEAEASEEARLWLFGTAGPTSEPERR